jgi:H+/Cl- antiporter ClcA
MLSAEQSHEFLDLYRRLGVALLRYLSRNLGGLILASLPLLALAGAISASVFPHLSDPELMFFGMAAVGAAGAMIWRRRT